MAGSGAGGLVVAAPLAHLAVAASAMEKPAEKLGLLLQRP